MKSDLFAQPGDVPSTRETKWDNPQRSPRQPKTQSRIGNYRTLPIIRTTCYVVFVKNCLNLDIDYILTDDQAARYQDCISHDYTYSDMHPDTFELGQPRTGKAYRSRLLGIASNGKKYKKFNQSKQYLAQRATTDVMDAVMMTSGFFICELGDIDIFSRVLVTLYDPITMISLNQTILNSYTAAFSKYNSGIMDNNSKHDSGIMDNRGNTNGEGYYRKNTYRKDNNRCNGYYRR